MINLFNVNKLYRTKSIITTALNNVSLHVNSGEFVAIMGPSGCGKSTLLNIIGLLDKPTDGRIVFDGTRLSFANMRKTANFRTKNIGIIFQDFNLIDEISVYENIELPLRYQGISSSEAKDLVQDVAEKVGVAHRLTHMPLQLSGGQQQRVAVARALVSNPRVILADEPAGNLDSKSGNEVMKLLAELSSQGTTIIMVTHSPEHATYADRLINMLDGKIIGH